MFDINYFITSLQLLTNLFQTMLLLVLEVLPYALVSDICAAIALVMSIYSTIYPRDGAVYICMALATCTE